MPTTVVSTIGTGGDYSTPQAWEDAAPANLVTSDQVWEGRLKNQAFTINAGWGIALTISGSTSDATRYKRLTCEAGASFRDNASKLTNALRYNTANGAAIVTSANSSGAGCMSFDEAYCRVDSIQFSVTGSNNTCVSTVSANVTVEHCVIQSTGACLGQNYGTIRNCVLINVSNSAGQSTLNQSRGTGTTINCTIVTPSDHAATTNAINRLNYGCSYKNCAFFGCTNVSNTTSGLTFTNCYTDSSQSFSGMTQIAYDTSTGSGFEATANATADFRIKSTSTLKDAGTSSGAPTVDIVDTARSGSYDVGAWEYTSGGGGPSFTAKSLKPLLQSIGGMY